MEYIIFRIHFVLLATRKWNDLTFLVSQLVLAQNNKNYLISPQTFQQECHFYVLEIRLYTVLLDVSMYTHLM